MTKLVRPRAEWIDGGDIGEKDGVSGASLRREGSVGTGFNFEVEDVRGVALIEDEKDLGEVAVSISGLDGDDLIDAGLEEGEVLAGHGCSLLG
jgi:hypothetical protein